MSLTRAERQELLQRMLALLDERYVFPDMAAAVRQAVEEDLAAGAHDTAQSDADFCAAVTARMLAVSGDKHLRLRPRAAGRMAGGPGMSPDELEAYRQQAAAANWGFQKVERLAGNVGYLDMRQFSPPEFAGDTAVATMNFLANSAALIIDLRQSPGGHGAMVALLQSYLLGPNVHINSVQWRGGETFQSWTLPYVPGRRMLQTPVYVLTSDFTFSAAEEFTYNLKTRKRATVVGEVTRGGANPGGNHRLTEEIEVFIPVGRAVNPISQDNWEGRGIEPDVAVPAAEAFRTAYAAALRQVIDQYRREPAPWAAVLAAEAETALAGLQP